MPKTFIPTNTGKLLRLLRQEKNISCRRLGINSFISREMIVAIENGRSNPSLHLLIQILDFFDCELLIVKKDSYKNIGKIEIVKTTSNE